MTSGTVSLWIAQEDFGEVQSQGHHRCHSYRILQIVQRGDTEVEMVVNDGVHPRPQHLFLPYL